MWLYLVQGWLAELVEVQAELAEGGLGKVGQEVEVCLEIEDVQGEDDFGMEVGFEGDGLEEGDGLDHFLRGGDQKQKSLSEQSKEPLLV